MATTKDIARALDIDEQTVRRYAREGIIPFAETLGGHRRYDLDEVRAALARARARRLEPLDPSTEQSARLSAEAGPSTVAVGALSPPRDHPGDDRRDCGQARRKLNRCRSSASRARVGSSLAKAPRLADEHRQRSAERTAESAAPGRRRRRRQDRASVFARCADVAGRGCRCAARGAGDDDGDPTPLRSVGDRQPGLRPATGDRGRAVRDPRPV